jgi:glutamate carboxypeptidase
LIAAPATTAREVLAWLSARQGEMVDFLRRLALIETPSLCPEAQGPAFDLLAEPLVAAGFRVRRRRGKRSGGQLYAVPRERVRGRPAQLLLGHVDTVWPAGTLATMPVELRGGRLAGPGVFDMKGGLTQAAFALAALAALGLEPPATPVVFVSSDEEVWSLDAIGAVRHLARRAARVFVLEPSLGPEGRLKTQRKGVGHFKVTVRGKAAHSGLDPEKGASAIAELAHVIDSLHGLADPARGITVNVGLVRGGERVNIVAPEAIAEAEVRLLSAADREEIEGRIRALRPLVAGTSLAIEGRFAHPPLERTPRNRALYELAVQAAGELGFALDEAAVGGGSDGNTTSLFAATLDGLGAVGDGAHAAHEFVEVDRLPERAALLALLLLAPVDGEHGTARRGASG